MRRIEIFSKLDRLAQSVTDPPWANFIPLVTLMYTLTLQIYKCKDVKIYIYIKKKISLISNHIGLGVIQQFLERIELTLRVI